MYRCRYFFNEDDSEDDLNMVYGANILINVKSKKWVTIPKNLKSCHQMEDGLDTSR
jgi:hypothetical protein